MRKIKTLTSLVLLVGLLFSVSIINVSAKTIYGDFEMEYDSSSKSYTIINYLGQEKDVVIPEKIYGRLITKIDVNAFRNNDKIETVSVPYLLTHIGEYAFSGCTSLKSFNIPSFVRGVGQYAFYGCTSLKTLTMDCKITAINDSVFENCSSLESVTIPTKVKTIYSNAFSGCTNLESVTIYNGVSAISDNAFVGCSDNFSIKANEGSYAETFAQDNNINFIEIPPIYGDVNGDGKVDIRDSTFLQRSVNNETGYEIANGSNAFKRADVNGDDNVNIIDATYIQKYLLHMIDELPVK